MTDSYFKEMLKVTWKINFHDNATKVEHELYFGTYPKQKHCKVNFERDVTANPFYHPVYKRITKLKGSFEGKYRWSQSNTRIIYFPDKESQTVFPIETGTATSISYKIKSKKKKRK